MTGQSKLEKGSAIDVDNIAKMMTFGKQSVSLFGVSEHHQAKILICFAIGIATKMATHIDAKSLRSGIYVAAISTFYKVSRSIPCNAFGTFGRYIETIDPKTRKGLLFFLSGFVPELTMNQLSFDSTLFLLIRSSSIGNAFNKYKNGHYMMFYLVNLVLGALVFARPAYFEKSYIRFLEQTTDLNLDQMVTLYSGTKTDHSCKDNHPDHESCFMAALHIFPKNLRKIFQIYGTLHGITFLFHRNPRKFADQMMKSIMFYLMYATVGRSIYCAYGKLTTNYYKSFLVHMGIWGIATSSILLENKHRVPEYSLFLMSKVVACIARSILDIKGGVPFPHDKYLSALSVGLTFINWSRKMHTDNLKSLDKSAAKLLFD